MRDKFNVPHVYGKTHDDVVWASGWILQEDRGLLLAQARYPARLAALDAPGINSINLIVGLKQVTVTPQADRMIESQATALLKARQDGPRAAARHRHLRRRASTRACTFEKSTAKPFTRVDIYAFNAVAGQLFGRGGGDEARRAQFLSGLTARLGDERGQPAVRRPLRAQRPGHADDDDALGPYERDAGTNDRSGNAILDAGSFQSRAGDAGRDDARRRLEPHKWASNFLMVSGKRSAHRPSAVRRRPADRLLLPRPDVRARPHGPGLRGARRVVAGAARARS